MDDFDLRQYLAEGKLLKEETYPFKESGESYDETDDSLLNVKYTFKTPKNSYEVNFYSGEYSPLDKTFDLSFGLESGRFNKIDPHQYVGDNDVYNVLKTISYIIKEFLLDYNEEADKIIIDPTDEKRKRVYKQLFPKYLPSNILPQIYIK